MRMKKSKKSAVVRLRVGFVLVLLAMILFMAAHWCWRTFGNVPFDQILFHLFVPMEGANTDVFAQFALRYLPFAFLWTGLIMLLVIRWTKSRTVLTVTVRDKERAISVLPFRFLRRHFAVFGVVLLLVSLFTGAATLQLPAYIHNQMNPSMLYEESYVDPRTASLTFPETKRNLIYIYLESMENTYASRELGGNQDVDLIPELTSLAQAGIQFSNTMMLGGAQEVPGTNWTVAAMTAQTAGVPLKVPVDRNSYGSNGSSFLPGVYSLGDVLEAEGYNQMLMVGSDAGFGGRRAYFTQHGGYRIWDYYTAKQEGRIAQDYRVWWGYEDSRLFEYAKESITALAAEDAPFNFTMLTVDTHYEGGYTCPLCLQEHGDKYANVLSCSSRQVAAFVDWIQEQDFYDNTTVILSGDHNCMSKTFFQGNGSYVRTTYNAFINPVLQDDFIFADTDLTRNRQFCSMDMYPTTLASLGVLIDGERLGLGTNLFSGKPTLMEEMGLEAFTQELDKASRFYDRNLLYPAKNDGSQPSDSSMFFADSSS